MTIKVGNIVCNMVFLFVDIDTCDLLLGLIFLTKIGAIVDIEKRVIQICNGLGAMLKCCHLM
jgi:hypothetical protein